MTTARHHHAGDRGAAGFSLAELVLALGVLAIGLTMAAALFPAAIKLNEQSTYDSIGTIIAANGLAITRSVVPAGAVGSTTLQSLTGAGAFATNQWLLKYPAIDPATVTNPEPTTRGYIPLGRRIEDPPGALLGYQLVIVAYDRSIPGSTVTAELRQITAVTTSSGGAPAARLDGDAPVGSPLIVAATGSYAKILEFNPSTGEAVLDHTLDFGAAGAPPPAVDAFVIVETGAEGKTRAMTVLVAETMLN